MNDILSDRVTADIFIVDDELTNIQTLSDLLKMDGYDVRAARDGKTALMMLNATPSDIILLDIRMPGMDGYEFCGQLKTNKRTRDIPIIFISALNEISDKAKAFQAGGVDYIVKPFHKDEVIMRIQTHLTLNRLQKNLQEMVAEQTKELLEANEELEHEIMVRRQVEKRLKRLSVATECAAEDIIITDKHGLIEYVNPAFEKVTGYSSEEVIGRSPRILQSGRHDTSFYQTMWQTLLNKKIWKGRFINRKKDKTLICQDASIAPILDTSRNISGFVSVKRDVTEQEKLKKQLIHAQKMEAIGTLSGGIAHDFNNILGGIIGYMELAIEVMKDQPQKNRKLERYLGRTLEAGDRAKQLVDQILQFSRRDMSATKLLKITPLVKETTKLLHATFPKTILIDLKMMADDDVIMADPTQIHQVLMNLCTNAYHAMRQNGGCLTISLKNVQLTKIKKFHTMTIQPGKYLKIKVADTGCGLPTDNIDRIFEPYFTTKKRGEGTGLGLSVTLGIIESHQGLIEVESISGQGTTFNIFLPVDRSSLSEPETIEARVPKGVGEKVLLIDDENFFLEAVQELIEMLGYNVTAIQKSPEALEIFKADSHGFDLVITDQTMPEMTGMQLIMEIRKLNPTIPIILCTGYSETVSEQTAKHFEISKFLMKPVQRKDLAQAINEVLKKE